MAINEVWLDENVPVLVSEMLASGGFAAHSAEEIGTRSLSDAVQLRECLTRGWVLITGNRRDFQRLHAMWTTLHIWGVLERPHAGIVTVYETDRFSPSDWAIAIQDLLRQTPSLEGLMYIWRPSTGEWELQTVALR